MRPFGLQLLTGKAEAKERKEKEKEEKEGRKERKKDRGACLKRAGVVCPTGT